MSVTFDDGNGNTVTLNPPLHGYRSVLYMPFEYSLRSDGTYGVCDHGSTYDRRKLVGAVFEMDVGDAGGIDGFFVSSQGRGSDITLSLSGGGFFPFGPDLGDAGDFVVRILDYDQSAQLETPYKYWQRTITMQYISGPIPAYSISDTVDDGTVQVGSTTGIRYPQAGWLPEKAHAINHTVTMDGVAYDADYGSSGDSVITSVTFSGNAGKMGALVNDMVSSIRSSNATIQTGDGNYPGGRTFAGSGTFTVQPLASEVNMVHNFVNDFSVAWRFRMVS